MKSSDLLDKSEEVDEKFEAWGGGTLNAAEQK